MTITSQNEFFYNDSCSKFVVGTQYMMYYEMINSNEESFFWKQVKDFWMVKIGPYFHKSYELQFLFVSQKNCPKAYAFESFIWGIFYMDFVGCLFRTSKLKNDISFY